MNKLVRMELQLPLFTYSGVAGRDHFGRVTSIAQTGEVLAPLLLD